MQKVILALLLVLYTLPESSQAEPITQINEPASKPRGLVVIAPAKKYLMHERLFEELARTLSKHGLLVVRFNWSAETLADPSLELQRAGNDISLVITEAQKRFNFNPQDTVLISKSFSTKALGESLHLASIQVLLTPNCSAEQPFRVTYEKLLKKKDLSTSIFISSEDPYCEVKQIYQALMDEKNPPALHITRGDHNFVFMKDDKTDSSSKVSYLYQDQVVETVKLQVMTDLLRKVNANP